MADSIVISALDPVAVSGKNGDLYPVVQDGVTKRINRAGILTSEVDNPIILLGAGDLGEVHLAFTDGGGPHLVIRKGDPEALFMNQAETKGIRWGADDTVSLLSDQNMVIKGDTALAIQCNVDILMDYLPATPGDWAGTAPIYVFQALNRLAAAVAGLLGTPVP